MGGLGKTTLAKLVYNDERVSSYFDKLIWVFVSEKFDSAEIMRAIIESDQGRCDVERMESLQSRLRKTLSGKRYLLVLDDVWNENQEAWLQLKSLLNVGKRGSKIIATTRSNIVANLMGTLPTHHLKGLPEEDCWSLFKQRAFPNRDEETYPDLVLIGREIVKKCKGVPLVAKVLGGLLHYKRSKREWLIIKNNEIWELKEDQIIPTLRLSYNHLPSQLKQCFTYCIIFHKGGTFKQQEVMQMWIAQGLIQSSEEGKLMEDIGAEYFDELCWRISELRDLQTLTLFIVSKENGIDELRDLNLRGSINIRNLQNVLNPLDADKVGLRERHKLSSLGLSWKDSHDSTAAENENSERVIESLQPHLNLLSLSIENYKGSRFPHWLVHLKVPNLVEVSLINCKRCKILPPLSQLHHLKELTIQDMPDLEKWSSDERSQTLPHIKQLKIKDCPKLTQMPHLPSVEELRLIGCNEMLLMSVMAYTAITMLWIGEFPEMISFPEGLLKNLTLIKDLYIHHCPKLKSLSKDVHDLPAIKTLMLENCGEFESLMEGVRNLTSLKSFYVRRCNHLTSLPHEGFQGLTSLEYLLIYSCDKLRSLGEGLQVQHLNSLVHLCVSDCPELAALPKSLFNLTALKILRLHELAKLASLSEEIENLASLEELEIEGCPNVLSLPASLQKVTTLQSLNIESCPSLEGRCAKEKGEDWYKIAHVSVILINGQCLQERK
ncbi:hypothetical protein AAC387_Pa02g0993 [Persea americana]